MKIVRNNDIVCLRHNNPDIVNKGMKVLDVSYSTGKVYCSWINEQGFTETGFFSSNSLRKVTLNRNKPIEKI